jgi:cytoskeletal protein RodZ
MDLLKRIIGIILVAAVITVVVVLVINFVRSRTSAPKTNTPVTNVVEEIKTVPSANTNNTPEVLPQTGNTNKKSLNSVGNVFSFPGWGVLTCSNSANFEFDPTDGRDNRVVCDIAQKPITVLVNNAAVCKGEMTTINGVSVQKYQVENIGAGDSFFYVMKRMGGKNSLPEVVDGFQTTQATAFGNVSILQLVRKER